MTEEAKRTPGQVEFGKYGPLSFEEMRSKYAQSLKATLDHFKGDILNEVHGVYLAGTEIRIADCGMSPNSPANAAYITESWNNYERVKADLERLCAAKAPLDWSPTIELAEAFAGARATLAALKEQPMKTDFDKFINEFIRELEISYQRSSDVMTPTEILETVLNCAKFAQSKATKE